MVKAHFRRVCWVCNAPLNISIRLTPKEYDLIHEFSVINPLDMTRNKVMYRICDRKAHPMCRVCYRRAKQPAWKYIRDRELGLGSRHVPRYCTTRNAITQRELLNWMERFKKYADSPDTGVDYDDELFFFPVTVPCMSGVNMEINYFS